METTDRECQQYYKEVLRACRILRNGNPIQDGDDIKMLGGGCCAVGGLESLEQGYDNSLSQKAKKNLIKKLSHGISKVFKTKTPSQNASDDEMVEHLRRIIPNPRKGKTIINNSAKQTKLCKEVAQVVNKTYGSQIIDTSLSPDGICGQVADIVDSLSAGMHQEFVAVNASVQRNLNNLQELKQLIEKSYEKLYSEAMASSDDALVQSVEGINDIHDLILREIDRQLAILANLTSTTLKPAARDMAKLLAENEDFKGLVASIKTRVGSTEWGDKLAYWLSGVNNTAHMASKVDKALKTIGMKAEDYKNQSKLADLTMRTQELMERLPANKLTRKAIKDFNAAVEIIKSHHNHHAQLSKLVKGAAEGGFDFETVEVFTGGKHCDGDVAGGLSANSRLGKKLRTQKKTRQIMLKDFKAKAKIITDRMYAAIFNIAQRMGKGSITITDDLHRLKLHLQDMTYVFRDGSEYALTGYYRHAHAREHKDRFVSLLHSLLNTLQPLHSVSTEFKTLSTQCEAFLKLIDFYHDKFQIHFGRISEDRPSKTGAGLAEMAVGGYDPLVELEVSGGGEFKAAVTLNNAKNTFDHFYNIAKFKVNLNTVQKELKTYNKNYESMTGAAVAKEIDAFQSNTQKLMKMLNAVGAETSDYGEGDVGKMGERLQQTLDKLKDGQYRNEANTGWGTAIDNQGAVLYIEHNPEDKTNYGKYRWFDQKGEKKNGPDTKKMGEIWNNWQPEHIKDILLKFDHAKMQLYKVAQAVDLYLQHFTDNVAASPDDIREVAKMLSSMELMANWFNEKSGDALAGMFEMLPWSAMEFVDELAPPEKSRQDIVQSEKCRVGDGKGHYFEKLVAHCGQARSWKNNAKAFSGTNLTANELLAKSDKALDHFLGNPAIHGACPKNGVKLLKYSKYVCDKIYVLKNIVSAFAYLGDKFGGESLMKNNFMSPQQMYKALSDYLYISALTMGRGYRRADSVSPEGPDYHFAKVYGGWFWPLNKSSEKRAGIEFLTNTEYEEKLENLKQEKKKNN